MYIVSIQRTEKNTVLLHQMRSENMVLLTELIRLSYYLMVKNYEKLTF